MNLGRQVAWVSLGILVLLLSGACGTAALPQPAPAATAVPPPTETSLPPSPTAEPPTPTPDPLIFRDDFEGSLDPSWHWLREKPRYWSLTNNPGWLEIMARAGGLPAGTMTNVLLRDAPQGNFELETRLNFTPRGNYQFAGLVIYDDAKNMITFGRAFCNNPACAGDGFYLDNTVDGFLNPENFATSAPAVDVVYLRLRRVGEALTGLASKDGITWTMIGTHRRESSPLFVGLVSGQALGSVPKPAQFDYFIITSVR